MGRRLLSRARGATLAVFSSAIFVWSLAMLYKIVGVLFLLAAMVFAADALRHAWNSRDGSIKAIAYAVLSVFLIEMVRVFQAEKHRRDDEARERRRLEQVERLARQAAMVD